MESKKINQLATNVAPVASDLTIVGDPTTGVSKKVTLSQIASLFAGAVDFYTNLAAFPATGVLNTIYCAKDTQKLYLWSGSAYVETFPSQSVLNTYQLLSEKGVSNGYASLDSGGKVPIAQLPSSIMEYKGLWSAATNTPTLANGTGDTGDVYICSAAGSVNFGAGAITFAVGDYVIYSGSIWQRSSGAVGTVTSVGLSSATSGVTIGSSPVTTSGTITLAIATATTSQNGLLSSTDWALFNGKESVLTFSSPLVRTTNTISIPAATTSVNGYLASADFTTFNNKQNAITLTTTGSSGVSTLVGATLNIPDYGSALTGYVPYTGATQDVDLGAFSLNGKSLHIKGTAGNGHLGLKHQSAAATGSANESLIYADSLGDLSWQNANLYLSKFITSANSANRSYTFPNATGTVALTSDISYPVTSVFGRTGAVVAVSADYNTSQVTEVTNLYYTDTRARLALSFVAGSGAYNNTTGVITIPTNNNQITNGAGYTTNVGTVTSVAATGGTGISITGSPITTSGTITITNSAPDQVVALTASTGISVTGTYPNFTITNTSPSSGGTVTSVAALTIGTSGTDLSSSVATSTTTPVITLNVPTASAANRGALSSADWTTFNNKQSALTNPVLASGTWTSGYLPKINGTYTIGNSIIQESGAAIIVAGNIQTDGSSNRYIKATGFISNQIGQLADFGAADAGYYVISGGGIQFVASGANRMLLDASGNLGLGVTPSAWGSGQIAFDIGTLGGLSTDGSSMVVANNRYFNGTNNIYKANGYSNLYSQGGGSHVWYNAPSGTAGNAITFTQAMTLTAAGRLLIGTPTEGTNMLDVYGEGRFYQPATTSTAYLKVENNRSRNAAIYTATTNGGFYAGTSIGTDTFNYQIYDAIAGSARLTIASTGAATFSSSVYAAQGIFSSDFIQNETSKVGISFASGYGQINSWGANTSTYGGLKFQLSASNGGTITPLTLAPSGAATFSSSVTVTGAYNVPSTSFFKGNTTYGYRFNNAADTVNLFILADSGAATFSSSVTATSFFESSSIKGKDIIATNPLLALDIDVIKYTRKSDESKDIRYGYSAEQIHSLMPELTDKDVTAVKYLDVHTILIANLQKEIRELKAKINN